MILEKVLIVDPLDGEYVGDVEIFDGKITNVRKKGTCPKYILFPGFVDLHTHGAIGIDITLADKNDLKRLEEFFYSKGVTSFLPTTVSYDLNRLKEVISYVQEYINENENTSVLGLHLEGPFISKKKKGAQDEKYILEKFDEDFVEFILKNKDVVKIMTVAPEVEDFFEYGKKLKESGIIISLGHSNADYSTVKRAFFNGFRRITHFPNALSGLHHRDMGFVGAVLEDDDARFEMIIDGVHSSAEFVKFVFKLKGCKNMTLITDSMAATGLKDGKYKLGDLSVTVEGSKALLDDGTIAGSVLTMDRAVSNLKKFLNCKLSFLSYVSSYNPVLDLKLFNLGRISENFSADLVLMDFEFNVLRTIKKGNVVYERSKIYIL